MRYSSSWENAGVDQEIVATLSRPAPRNLAAASWDGETRLTDPELADQLERVGWAAATTAGFVRWNTEQMWFADDGIDWTSVQLPQEAESVAGGFSLDDALIVVAVDTDGTSSVYRLDARGGSAERLAIPVPPATPAGLTSTADWLSRSAAMIPLLSTASEGSPTGSSSDDGLIDHLLLASVGDDRFVVHTLSNIDRADVVANGETLLVHAEDGWVRYEVPG